MPTITSRDAFLSLVAQIAEILPGSWDVRPFPEAWGADVNDPDTGASLYIVTSTWKQADRIEVKSQLPQDSKGETPYVGLQYGQSMPAITVSGNKSAEQIARDIERRLMPAYLPLLERARKQIAETEEYYNRTETMARKIAALVGVKIEKGAKKIDFYRSPLKIFNETMSGAEVHDQDVELTLRLDHDTALEILMELARRG